MGGTHECVRCGFARAVEGELSIEQHAKNELLIEDARETAPALTSVPSRMERLVFALIAAKWDVRLWDVGLTLVKCAQVIDQELTAAEKALKND